MKYKYYSFRKYLNWNSIWNVGGGGGCITGKLLLGVGDDIILTCDRLVIPRRKQMLSNIFDLPLPFKPVMALKRGSKPFTSVRLAYDLNPSKTIPLIYIFNRQYLKSRKKLVY